ncbi:MAG: transcriptional repressor [Bacteroidetes bacterium]|nr:transcriptional repressor [Bacteroidota bacterium]
MVENLLKKKKLRLTSFRNEVLNVFLNSSNAVSINDIEDKLKQFDRITLYRTLKTFKEKGLIHEIVMPGDIKKLALCPDECSSLNHLHTAQHIHFRCKMCENIFCLDLHEFPEINIPKFKVDSIEIQGSGICNVCS